MSAEQVDLNPHQNTHTHLAHRAVGRVKILPGIERGSNMACKIATNSY